MQVDVGGEQRHVVLRREELLGRGGRLCERRGARGERVGQQAQTQRQAANEASAQSEPMNVVLVL